MTKTITDPRPTDPKDPDYWSAPVWPDGVPTVSMDIGLGKSNKYIDFYPYDYAAFLDELGVQPDEWSKLDIRIREDKPLDDSMMEPPKTRTLGLYRPIHQNDGRGKIDIRLVDHLDTAKGSRTLLHETQHFADDLTGELRKKPSRDEREKRLAKRIGMRILGLNDPGHAEVRAEATEHKYRLHPEYSNIISSRHRHGL